MLIFGIIGWFLGAIITGILVVKAEECNPNCWDSVDIMMLAMLWPLALIILICEVFVMYVKYIKSGKERNEKLKQEKRIEKENKRKTVCEILKELKIR